MRPMLSLQRYRLKDVERLQRGEPIPIEIQNIEGIFEIESATAPGTILRVIASNDMGWDHVSISTRHRCPTWDEMEQIKHLFFRKHETAMQLHVPAADHINCHPYCLHLWRPHGAAIPLPPSIMVGPKT